MIAQHTANKNAEPSPSCTRAIEELMRYRRSPEVRGHLKEGWRQIAVRARPRPRGGQVEIDSPTRVALRRTLGDQVYKGLLAEIVGDRPQGGAVQTA